MFIEKMADEVVLGIILMRRQCLYEVSLKQEPPVRNRNRGYSKSSGEHLRKVTLVADFWT
ncbi:MAG: hypothetical protein B6A08_15665 [Sorangiineae bacterium NIC37A_2]|nr:MAG: hypothetical protein B6A08_15665 [Sorangiineae bacterium NIC37A_2]